MSRLVRVWRWEGIELWSTPLPHIPTPLDMKNATVSTCSIACWQIGGQSEGELHIMRLTDPRRLPPPGSNRIYQRAAYENGVIVTFKMAANPASCIEVKCHRSPFQYLPGCTCLRVPVHAFNVTALSGRRDTSRTQRPPWPYEELLAPHIYSSALGRC